MQKLIAVKVFNPNSAVYHQPYQNSTKRIICRYLVLYTGSKLGASGFQRARLSLFLFFLLFFVFYVCFVSFCFILYFIGLAMNHLG